MAAVGDVLENPVTGERFTVLAVPRDEEDWGRAEILFPPGAKGPPRHVHERTQERISVVEGVLTVSLGGRRDRRELRQGETLDLPPGVPHRFWNPSDAPVRLVGEARPGAQLGVALERLCQLAQQGKVTRRGAPKNPLEVALLFEQSGMYLTGLRWRSSVPCSAGWPASPAAAATPRASRLPARHGSHYPAPQTDQVGS